ncbi:MAG: glycosyltransferase [Methanosarcinaceae archaeon]
MHILIIPSWYPTPDKPINGIFFLEQAQALQKAGHKVNVLVPPILKSVRKLKEIQSLSDLKLEFQIEIYQGVKTYRSSAWKWVPLPFHWSKKYWFQRYGEQVFKIYLENEEKPDIIHAHSVLYGGYLAVQLAQKRQIPVVLTEHSSGFVRGTISNIQVSLVKKCLKKTDSIITVGPSLKKIMQSYTPQKKVEVLGNIVDVDFFSLSDKASAPPFVFCLIAFLTLNKGIDVVLQSFAKVFKNQNVVLKIAGDGVERDNLMALAERLNIAEQVDFMGLLSREEIRNLLHQSHALISSSYVETFGVNLIEAMACGKPIIATRSGGPEMFVNDKNGILIPTGDIDRLAKAMQRMIETYDSYDPEYIRSECANKFSEVAIIRQLETIYQDVTEAHAN